MTVFTWLAHYSYNLVQLDIYSEIIDNLYLRVRWIGKSYILNAYRTLRRLISFSVYGHYHFWLLNNQLGYFVRGALDLSNV